MIKKNYIKLKNILKNRLSKTLPFLIAYVGQALLRLIMLTCKVRIEGFSDFLKVAINERCILMLWHNRLALVAYFASKYASQFHYAAVISGSRDGNIIESIAKTYSFGSVIRVPHHARYRGLREMIRYLKQGKHILLMTPDGPRGPVYEVKQGIAMAAQATESYIIPFTWESTRFWRLNTWDGFLLPKPFSSVCLKLGTPIFMGKETLIKENDENLTQDLTPIPEASMNRLEAINKLKKALQDIHTL